MSSAPAQNPLSIGNALRHYVALFGRLFSYYGVTKVISVATTAYALRCLGPEKTGEAGYWLNLAALLTPLISLGWEPMLVRDYRNASPEERANLLSLWMSARNRLAPLIIATFVLAVGLWRGDLRSIYLASVAGLVLLVDTASLYWLFQSEERYSTALRIRMVTQLSGSVLIVLWFRAGQMVGSDLVVRGATGLLALFLSYRLLKGPRPQWRSLRETWRFGRNYTRQGLGFIALLWINYLLTQFSDVVLGSLNLNQALGYYRAGMLFAALIEEVLSLVATVFYQRQIDWYARSPQRLLRRSIILAVVSLAAGGLVSLLLVPIAPFVMRLVLGKEFVAASSPFVILAFGRFVMASKLFLHNALSIAQRAGTLAAITAPIGVLTAFFSYLAVKRYGIVGASWSIAASQGALLLGFAVAAFFLLRSKKPNQ